MKILSGTFEEPNKIRRIAIEFENGGWCSYSGEPVLVDRNKELLIVVRKYKGVKNDYNRKVSS